MLLHEEYVWSAVVHRDAVDAVPYLGLRFGNPFGTQPAVDRAPGRAGIVAAKCARRGDRRADALGIVRIEDDRVQTHAAGAGLPVAGRRMLAQSGELFPATAAVRRSEQGRIFDTR